MVDFARRPEFSPRLSVGQSVRGIGARARGKCAPQGRSESMRAVTARARLVSHTPSAQARCVVARRRNALAWAAWKQSQGFTRHLTASRRRSCRRSWLLSVPGPSTTLSLSSTASSALSFASSVSLLRFFLLLFAILVAAFPLVLREGEQRDAQHPQPHHECSSTERAHNSPSAPVNHVERPTESTATGAAWPLQTLRRSSSTTRKCADPHR